MRNKLAKSNEDLITKWVNGDLKDENGDYWSVKEKHSRYGQSYREVMFENGRVLYSYGIHWPLALRQSDGTIIRNGDRFRGGFGSSTGSASKTPEHVKFLESLIPDSPMISFATIGQILNGKGMSMYTDNILDFLSACNFIDTEKALSVVVVEGDDDWDKPIPAGITVINTAHDSAGNPTAKHLHRIGASLFEHVGKYYLAAMDEGSYFISVIPAPCKKVSKAFEMLKPSLVKQAEKQGRPVLRQGEWFMIPIENKNLLEKATAFEKEAILHPLRKHASSTNAHLVKVFNTSDGQSIVYGQMKHVKFNSKTDKWNLTGEHKTVKMETPHLLVCNTSLEDYSAESPVD